MGFNSGFKVLITYLYIDMLINDVANNMNTEMQLRFDVIISRFPFGSKLTVPIQRSHTSMEFEYFSFR